MLVYYVIGAFVAYYTVQLMYRHLTLITRDITISVKYMNTDSDGTPVYNVHDKESDSTFIIEGGDYYTLWEILKPNTRCRITTFGWNIPWINMYHTIIDAKRIG